MSDELKAAAERRRKWRKQHPVQAGWHHEDMDSSVLADAYLDEHTADDDEPVTEEWLGSLSHMASLRLWWNQLGCGWSWRGTYCGILDSVKTRGDVRRLCRALGVEMKETKESPA